MNTMLTDAHCHPWDLHRLFPAAEEERRLTGCPCAASAWNREQFEFHEALARRAEQEGAPPILRCFAVHPQLPASGESAGTAGEIRKVLLPLLETLGAEKRLDAVGETGFDLYDQKFRDTAPLQEEIFRCHLETALRYGLPLVIHLRRAMDRIFAHTGALKKLPSVIFHSWPGTAAEGEALLRRGVNAFFSFGAPITLNHKEAMRCAALFPEERLLLETDAPWQPPRSQPFSRWTDLPIVCAALARLRRGAGSPGDSPEALEALTAANFFRAFGKRGEAAAESAGALPDSPGASGGVAGVYPRWGG